MEPHRTPTKWERDDAILDWERRSIFFFKRTTCLDNTRMYIGPRRAILPANPRVES